jgi:hypothetical protein
MCALAEYVHCRHRPFFFITFVGLAIFVILNMLIAIISDAYTVCREKMQNKPKVDLVGEIYQYLKDTMETLPVVGKYVLRAEREAARAVDAVVVAAEQAAQRAPPHVLPALRAPPAQRPPDNSTAGAAVPCAVPAARSLGAPSGGSLGSPSAIRAQIGEADPGAWALEAAVQHQLQAARSLLGLLEASPASPPGAYSEAQHFVAQASAALSMPAGRRTSRSVEVHGVVDGGEGGGQAAGGRPRKRAVPEPAPQTHSATHHPRVLDVSTADAAPDVCEL